MLFYFACEAAGASSARHSLRPLNFQMRFTSAKLARITRRERGGVGVYNQQSVGWVEHLRNPSSCRAPSANHEEEPRRCDGYRCAPPILRGEFQIVSRRQNSRELRGEIAAALLVQFMRGHDPIRLSRIMILSFCLSMIFSENRFPLFRIML
jgi:hypothetical protein